MHKRNYFTWIFVLAFAWTLGGQTLTVAEGREQLQRVEAFLDAAQYIRADSLLKEISPEIAALNNPELEAEVLHLSGYIGLETGDYNRAFTKFREAVDRAGTSFREHHPLTGQAHNDLGHFFFSTGQLDSAWQQHQVALAIRLENFGPNHSKVGDSYNNLGNVLQTSGRSAEALEYYQKVLKIRRSAPESDPADIAATLNNLGNAYLSLGQIDRATNAFRRTLDIRMQLFGPDHPAYGRSLQNLGNAFYHAGTLDSARFYYEIALENARSNYDTIHPQLADLYENLGNCALKANQFDAAERWHKRALGLRETLSEMDPIAPATSYLHLGDIYRQMGDYLEAMRMTEKGWAVLKLYLQDTDPYLADAWEKLGLCHQMMGHFLEARDAFMNAQQIRWTVYGPNHPMVAGSYTNLGNIYWQQSDLSTAIYYYREALAIWERYGGDYAKEKAEAYSNIGNCFIKDKEWQNALDAYRQALPFVSGESRRLSAIIWQQIGVAYDGLRRFSEAIEAFDKSLGRLNRSEAGQQNDILFTLGARANTLLHLYERDGNRDTLQRAADSFAESMDLLNRQQLNILHTESRQKGVALHYDLFASAIRCQLALWELEKDSTYLWRAFQLSEESKSLRLREKWLDSSSEAGKDINHSSPLAGSLHVDEASARNLREKLTGNQGLLAFFSGPERLFWFYLKDDRLQAGVIPDIEKVDQLISELGLTMVQYPVAGSEEKVMLDSIYRGHARELYRRIWEPVAANFSGASQLVIVPDGSLAYLPFAVLLTEEPRRALRYRSYPYLLQKFQISYAYSAALLAKAMHGAEPPEELNCLAVAPVFEGYDPPLAPLTYNTVEVNELARQIGAITLTGPEASRERFLEMAPHYRILHLATHGVANINRSEYSYLAFSLPEPGANGRLYVQDLYQLDLPADMIVMSACESGVGRYQAGEGNINLGRGFVAAGARSIIATLWSVNDAKTAEFMEHFYKHLRAGMSKDAALRTVQQAYLKSATQEDAHPFFWAAYLPIGDMIELELGRRPYSGLLYGAGLLVLLALGWWLKPRLLKNLSK